MCVHIHIYIHNTKIHRFICTYIYLSNIVYSVVFGAKIVVIYVLGALCPSEDGSQTSGSSPSPALQSSLCLLRDAPEPSSTKSQAFNLQCFRPPRHAGNFGFQNTTSIPKVHNIIACWAVVLRTVGGQEGMNCKRATFREA